MSGYFARMYGPAIFGQGLFQVFLSTSEPSFYLSRNVIDLQNYFYWSTLNFLNTLLLMFPDAQLSTEQADKIILSEILRFVWYAVKESDSFHQTGLTLDYGMFVQHYFFTRVDPIPADLTNLHMFPYEHIHSTMLSLLKNPATSEWWFSHLSSNIIISGFSGASAALAHYIYMSNSVDILLAMHI